MKLGISAITKRDRIKDVLDRWKNQYAGYPSDYLVGKRGEQEAVGVILKRLKALNLSRCSEKDVDKAIGTDKWAENGCDICGSDVLVTAYLQHRYSDERTMSVCPKCLETALARCKAAVR